MCAVRTRVRVCEVCLSLGCHCCIFEIYLLLPAFVILIMRVLVYIYVYSAYIVFAIRNPIFHIHRWCCHGRWSMVVVVVVGGRNVDMDMGMGNGNGRRY